MASGRSVVTLDAGPKSVMSRKHSSALRIGTRTTTRRTPAGWRGLALLFLLPLALRAGTPAVQATDSFAIESWSTDRGLPQNSVNALIQSRAGYLWLGTYNGLARFDGVRFTVFNSANTPVMRNSRITSLLEDAAGSLWIGHETGELTRRRDGVFTSVNLSNRWPGGTVQNIGQDEHSDLWLLNMRGDVMRLRDGLVLERFPGIGREPGGTPEMIKHSDGRLIVSRNGGVAFIENGRWARLDFGDPSAYYSRTYPAREGGLWVVGSTNIQRWQGERWAESAGKLPAEISFVPTLSATRASLVLVGSLNRGLLICEPGKESVTLDTTSGLLHDWVKCIVEDREGNIWIGTRGGLSVLRPRKVVMRSPPDGWHNVLPLSIAPGANNSVWAGSEGGGLFHFDGKSWRNFGIGDGLSNPYVWSVLENANGDVWAGTWSGGLFRGRDGRFAVPEALAGLTDPITALLEFPAHTIWIGTGKGLARFKDGKLERFESLGGAAAGDVRALAPGMNEELWLGTLGSGLGKFAEGKIQSFTARDGLPGDFILSLLADADGTLWIGTLERGLSRLKQGRFSTISTKQGLPGNIIGHIADDGAGKLWFNSSQGIFSASKADLNRVADSPDREQLLCLAYGASEGLTTLGGSAGFTPSGFRSSDGNLWMPTAKGLAVVNPAQTGRNPLPPPEVIEEISIGGRPFPTTAADDDGTKALQVPPSSQQIEIHFTALSYSAPEKVRFKWRLEGLEKEWSEPKADRHATYSYLAPGKYVFRVTACNNDGVWNETSAVLGVTVLPEFWETWWFKFLLLTAILALFGGSIFFIQRSRMRRNLERAARERELERERARIAQDIHDDLGASLTRIGMLSQTAGETPADTQRTSQYLGQIYSAAREMTRSMDEIVWAVNPSHDTLESLFNYLTRFAHEFLTPARIRCRFQVPVEFSDQPVRSEIRHNLFLAFKETLHNVVRHSGADEVQIKVELTNRALHFSITDNGHGAASSAANASPSKPDRIATGHGFANLRSRMEKIGGTSRRTNLPGRGLVVELTVPLSGKLPPSA